MFMNGYLTFLDVSNPTPLEKNSITLTSGRFAILRKYEFNFEDSEFVFAYLDEQHLNKNDKTLISSALKYMHLGTNLSRNKEFRIKGDDYEICCIGSFRSNVREIYVSPEENHFQDTSLQDFSVLEKLILIGSGEQTIKKEEKVFP